MKRVWAGTCAPGPDGRPILLTVAPTAGPVFPAHPEARIVEVVLPRTATGEQAWAALVDAVAQLPAAP